MSGFVFCAGDCATCCTLSESRLADAGQFACLADADELFRVGSEIAFQYGNLIEQPVQLFTCSVQFLKNLALRCHGG